MILDAVAFMDDMEYLNTLADALLLCADNARYGWPAPPHPPNLTVYDRLVCELGADTQAAIFAPWPT